MRTGREVLTDVVNDVLKNTKDSDLERLADALAARECSVFVLEIWYDAEGLTSRLAVEPGKPREVASLPTGSTRAYPS